MFMPLFLSKVSTPRPSSCSFELPLAGKNVLAPDSNNHRVLWCSCVVRATALSPRHHHALADNLATECRWDVAPANLLPVFAEGPRPSGVLNLPIRGTVAILTRARPAFTLVPSAFSAG